MQARFDLSIVIWKKTFHSIQNASVDQRLVVIIVPRARWTCMHALIFVLAVTESAEQTHHNTRHAHNNSISPPEREEAPLSNDIHVFTVQLPSIRTMHSHARPAHIVEWHEWCEQNNSYAVCSAIAYVYVVCLLYALTVGYIILGCSYMMFADRLFEFQVGFNVLKHWQQWVCSVFWGEVRKIAFLTSPFSHFLLLLFAGVLAWL